MPSSGVNDGVIMHMDYHIDKNRLFFMKTNKTNPNRFFGSSKTDRLI
jgi:hypothetical protein